MGAGAGRVARPRPDRPPGTDRLGGRSRRLRRQVNSWIRTSGAFDGVVDSDRAMQSPSDPMMLNPSFDSGDHLHPDDTGYQAIL